MQMARTHPLALVCLAYVLIKLHLSRYPQVPTARGVAPDGRTVGRTHGRTSERVGDR